MTLRLAPILSIVALVGAAECFADTEPNPGVTTDASAPKSGDEDAHELEPGEVPVKPHMHEHVAHADELRHALRRGDLEAAKKPATWMHRHPAHSELREVWTPYAAAMHGAAHDVAYATSVAEAATATGKLAKACGECHAVLERGPRYEAGAEPESRAWSSNHRLRYRWALDRMWEGIVQPNDARWQEGTEVLAKPAIEPEHLPASLPPDVAALRTKVPEIGARAMGAKDFEARSGVLAEVISACATCHATARATPASD